MHAHDGRLARNLREASPNGFAASSTTSDPALASDVRSRNHDYNTIACGPRRGY